MKQAFIEDQVYKGNDFTQQALDTGEYESCTFSQCSFSNTDLSENTFSNCLFEDCDLSMAKLKETAFRELKFKGCKLLGLRFDDCNQFSLSFEFEHCVLNFSSFYKMKLKGIRFSACKLESVDFVQTDLTSALFKDCDLKLAVFENTILESCDLRSSYNFSINPALNKIKKAKFSAQNVVGLLDQYQIIIE